MEMFIPSMSINLTKLATNMVIRIVCLSVFILCFVPTSFSVSSFQRLYLPVPGPDSFDFDLIGKGPYTAVADGRILKYEGPLIGFVTYGYTIQNRPAKFCDGTNNIILAQICGRGLGLGFYYKTGQLFIADAANGFMVVGPLGGPGQQLVTSANWVPFKFTDDVEVDQETGTVYFTDASSNYNISQIAEAVVKKDMSGRVLKYEIKTKKVTLVLLSGLAGASGVAISKDGSYLLVSEFIINRVQKYWLKGPKANTLEVLLNVSGNPERIRRNQDGDFWIAVNVQSQEPTPIVILQGQKINGNGTLLQTITFSPEFNTSLITEVKEYKGKLYLGSLDTDYVGVYKI